MFSFNKFRYCFRFIITIFPDNFKFKMEKHNVKVYLIFLGKSLELSSGKKRHSKTPENVIFDKQKMLLEVKLKPKGSTVSESIRI